MAAWNQREMSRAATQFRKAAEIDRRDPELWIMIGKAEGADGKPDLASQAWEEALKQVPGYKPALFERGKEALGRHVTRRIPPPVDAAAGWLPLRLEPAARAEGGADEAKRILADLREAASHSTEFTAFAKGAIHLLDGRYRDAHPPLQEYADQNAWDTTALAMLGIAAQYGSSPERAERALSEALKRRFESGWMKVRADARYLQGNLAGAREGYREAGVEKESEPLFERRIPSQGLTLWLRADAGVELAGASVTAWRDQSGAKHDAVAKDPAAGPQVSPSAVRGKPALAFSGKEDYLQLPDGFEDLGAGLSLFVVGEPMTEPSEEWSFVLLATPARGAARIEAGIGRRRDSDQVVYFAEDLEKQNKPFLEGLAAAKQFELIGAIHEPSGTVRLYTRGKSPTEKTLILPRKTLRTRNRVGAGLKGRVAEVVLYSRSLSEQERLGVETYLRDRYFGEPPSVPAATSPERR